MILHDSVNPGERKNQLGLGISREGLAQGAVRVKERLTLLGTPVEQKVGGRNALVAPPPPLQTATSAFLKLN